MHKNTKQCSNKNGDDRTKGVFSSHGFIRSAFLLKRIIQYILLLRIVRLPWSLKATNSPSHTTGNPLSQLSYSNQLQKKPIECINTKQCSNKNGDDRTKGIFSRHGFILSAFLLKRIKQYILLLRIVLLPWSLKATNSPSHTTGNPLRLLSYSNQLQKKPIECINTKQCSNKNGDDRTKGVFSKYGFIRSAFLLKRIKQYILFLRKVHLLWSLEGTNSQLSGHIKVLLFLY